MWVSFLLPPGHFTLLNLSSIFSSFPSLSPKQALLVHVVGVGVGVHVVGAGVHVVRVGEPRLLTLRDRLVASKLSSKASALLELQSQPSAELEMGFLCVTCTSAACQPGKQLSQGLFIGLPLNNWGRQWKITPQAFCLNPENYMFSLGHS